MARSAAKRVFIEPRQDNQCLDAHYPDGVVGTALDILIAEIPNNLNIVAGTSYSENFDTLYVSGADSSGATYALEIISGSLASTDLSFTSAGLLSDATPTAGTFTARLLVTKSGQEFRSNNFARTVIASQSPDTLAPATAPAPTAVINSATQITVSGYFSMDPETAAIASSGMSEMILQRATVTNGVEGAWADRQTFPAPTLGFRGLLQEVTVGSPSGTVATSQTGANYTITSGLGSLSGTSDSFIGRRIQISGNFRVRAQLGDFDNQGDQFAASVLMLRDSLDPGSPMARIRRWNQPSGLGISLVTRGSPGGTTSASSAQTANIPADAFVQFEKTGNQIIASFQNTSGEWIAVGSPIASAYSDPVEIVLTGIRSSAGPEVTFPIRNVQIDILTPWQHIDSTSANTSYRYRVLGRDAQTNLSAVSPVSATFTTPNASASYKKVHRGWYVLLDKYKSTPETRAAHHARMQAFANEPNVKGFKLQIMHGDIETTPGDYSQGFAIIDSYLDALPPGKRLMISIFKSVFGSVSPANLTNGFYFPRYITDNPSVYGITPLAGTNAGYTERVWRAAVIERWCLMSEAFQARYDDDDRFEMYQTGETSISVQNGLDGFSNDAWLAQLLTLLDRSADAWVHTILRCSTNFLGQSRMQTLIAYCATRGIACGGPDVIPKESIEANRIFSGYTGGIDYRGVIIWVAEWQSPSMGGKEGNWSESELDRCTSEGFSVLPVGQDPDSVRPMSNSYTVVYDKVNFPQNGAAQGGTGPPGGIDMNIHILPYMRTHPGYSFAGCPSAYNNLCTF